MCCYVFSYSKSAVWVWTVILSHSQGSVSTLFRWGGYIFRFCVKRFFLLIAMQKLFKLSVFLQSYDVKCIATIFSVHSVIKRLNGLRWFFWHGGFLPPNLHCFICRVFYVLTFFIFTCISTFLHVYLAYSQI